MRTYTLLALLLTAALTGRALGQGSTVAPGPGGVLLVDGTPFYPLGWTSCGTCTETYPSPATFTTNRDSVLAHLETMRRHGVNTLMEYSFADGRIVARGVDPGWFNWYEYSAFKGDSTRRTGHPRPGVYVEGMRWLMDQAVNAAAPKIFTVVSLQGFVTPGYRRTASPVLPYSGDDTLRCDAYRTFINDERRENLDFAHDPELAGRIPPVDCAGQEERRMPFWEWNLWYVVRNLRDHPGLLGWFLWDEAEGVSYRHLFGIPTPRAGVRVYTGPGSLPTPDLLRYVYTRVRQFESEGKPPGYQRHPIIVDIAEPHAFFSRRFSWSREGRLDPAWSSGPFDRAPGGGYHTPAEILGQEASAMMAYTAARGATPRHDWYWDQNYTSRSADMLVEAARRDNLWGSLVAAAQAQLPSRGGYAVEGDLRCEPNDELRSRYLNDRDLVWQLLTLQAIGMRGHLYYSHALMPAAGQGAEQVRRSNRLLQQFREAGLDTVLLTPPVTAGWSVGRIFIPELTHYFRSDPAFVGPARTYDPGRSAFTGSFVVDGASYTAALFGRTGDRVHYGHAIRDPQPSTHAAHRLLQTAYHRYKSDAYLVLSNAYDARVAVEVFIDWPGSPFLPDFGIREGVFNLGAGGAFRWRERPHRLAYTYDPARQHVRLLISMEPYEARLFRLDAGL